MILDSQKIIPKSTARGNLINLLFDAKPNNESYSKELGEESSFANTFLNSVQIPIPI